MSACNDRASWLTGGQVQCSIPAKPRARPPRFVLLGAPGVGKGTQAELLCAGMGVCQLSTGDIFRASKCLAEGERSPAMSEALRYMQRGELVPDSTVLNLIRERVRCLKCRGGFLLDGFPRTVPQAEALYDLLEENRVRLEAVLNYTLPFSTIVERLSGRRTCVSCKSVFHVTGRDPRVADVCDHCGGKLVQREDDCPEAVEVRMLAYETSTKPLIDFYAGHGLSTDYIDLVLLHCVTSPKWPEECRKQMDLLSKLKEQGKVRALGVSCHSLEALELCATESWVESVHTRINPYGMSMDGPPEKVVPVLKKIHAAGKGVVGMKIIGEGRLRNDPEKRQASIKFALELGCVDVLNVGCESIAEVEDLAASIKKVQRAA